ncbi:MAG TPA: TonB-dependent receptor [Burkholderiaceae bacterium]
MSLATRRSAYSISLTRLLAASPALLAAVSVYAQEQAPAAAPAAPAPAATVQAAPAAAPAKADPSLQKVQVQGQANTYDARRFDTATKVVITQEEILKNGDTTVAEVLKRLPGVTVGGVQGRGGAIQMRGMGAYTQVLLNGEPSPPGFSLDQVSPDMIERIEIMRAATAEFSTQAIAGAINIVLKRAIVTAQRELKVGAIYDNGKGGGTANLQISDKKGPMSYSLAGGLNFGTQVRPEATQYDTVQGPTGAVVSQRVTKQSNSGEFKNINVSPRVNYTLSPNDTVTLQTFLTANTFDGKFNETIVAGVAPLYQRTQANIDVGFAMARADVTWTRKLGNSAKLENKGGVSYNRRSLDLDGQSFNTANVQALTRHLESTSSDKGLTLNGKYSTPWREGHALAFGWDGAYNVRDEDRVQAERSAVGNRTDSYNETYEASVRRLAVFGQDEWNVTPRWSVYLGLRWEGIEVKTQGSTFRDSVSTSSVWSPIFQTLWKLPDTKNDQLRLAVTRTYKAPDVGNLIPRGFATINNSPTSPDAQGNPNLKPELAWGVDLAYEHYIEGGGLLSASTYVRKIDGYTRSLVSLINDRWILQPVNAGNATTRGIELEAKLPLKSLIKDAPAIDLRANLSRNWSEVDNIPGPNNRLDQQVPFSGNFGIDYKAAALPLTLGGNFNFQAGGPLRYATNQYRYNAYKRSLDVYALWKFDPKTNLRISVSNALHQDNVSDTAYVDARGTQYQQTVNPTVAQVRAMLEMKF